MEGKSCEGWWKKGKEDSCRWVPEEGRQRGVRERFVGTGSAGSKEKRTAGRVATRVEGGREGTVHQSKVREGREEGTQLKVDTWESGKRKGTGDARVRGTRVRGMGGMVVLG